MSRLLTLTLTLTRPARNPVPALPLARAMALSALCFTAAAAPALAQASPAEGPWLVRARAVHLDPANHDSTGLNLGINSKTLPELDISYFFTPNLAAELVLTIPQKQTVSAGGARIGQLRHLPPTLTLQYHFAPDAGVRPYVGAGLNYTRFSSVRFDPAVQAALGPGIDKNSVGLALQAGVDVPLGHGLYVNVDVKKVRIRTDVSSFGAHAGTFKVDPVLVGVGLGWRF